MKKKTISEKVKFVHLPLSCNGGIDCHCTVAYVYDREKKKVTYGIAYCSPNDRFNKKTGRKISERRLNEDPTVLKNFAFPSHFSPFMIGERIIDIQNFNFLTPSWFGEDSRGNSMYVARNLWVNKTKDYFM